MTIKQAPKRALSPIEKLPMLVALEKVVKDEIKSVRRECDDALLDGYESMDVVKRALKVGGQKVGEFTVSVTPIASHSAFTKVVFPAPIEP